MFIYTYSLVRTVYYRGKGFYLDFRKQFQRIAARLGDGKFWMQSGCDAFVIQ